MTRTIKASRKLHTGAGNFPEFTCGNRRHSLPTETADICYLRKFLPASADNFACGTGYLQPSQVILHAPISQCGYANDQWYIIKTKNVRTVHPFFQSRWRINTSDIYIRKTKKFKPYLLIVLLGICLRIALCDNHILAV